MSEEIEKMENKFSFLDKQNLYDLTLLQIKWIAYIRMLERGNWDYIDKIGRLMDTFIRLLPDGVSLTELFDELDRRNQR